MRATTVGWLVVNNDEGAADGPDVGDNVGNSLGVSVSERCCPSSTWIQSPSPPLSPTSSVSVAPSLSSALSPGGGIADDEVKSGFPRIAAVENDGRKDAVTVGATVDGI